MLRAKANASFNQYVIARRYARDAILRMACLLGSKPRLGEGTVYFKFNAIGNMQRNGMHLA